MTTSGKTVRIWITDGSLVPFTDSVRLPATHRAIFGLRAPYKGCIDASVAVGTAVIHGERTDEVLVPEAEWCLSVAGGFGRYFEQPDDLSEATPLILQGLIEGKWLNRFIGTTAWRPATLGNNLLAGGPGLSTTLAQIEQGTAQGEVQVVYQYPAGGTVRTRLQRTTLADLRGQNILGLVRAVLRYCQDTGQMVDRIDLSAVGEAAAVVNERRRLNRSMRFAHLPIFNPFSLLRRHDVAQRLVAGILAEGLGVPAGAPVTIVNRDQQGQTVGEGTLTWVAT